MNQNRDDQLADLITERALNPDTPPPPWVTAAEWAEVEQLAALELELSSGARAAPPLERDRTAAMLGLIPDSQTQLAPTALKRVRKGAGLTIGDLAKRLAARGWDVTQADVFRWENQGAPDVPPALIEAISIVLRTDVAQLTKARSGTREAVVDIDAPAYRRLVDRLAEALGVTVDFAGARLRTAAATAVHRGERPQDDQLLATLEAYVRAVERRRER